MVNEGAIDLTEDDKDFNARAEEFLVDLAIGLEPIERRALPGTSFLGMGATSIAYETLFNGKHSVTKLTTAPADIENIEKMHSLRDEVPDVFKKHIMNVYYVGHGLENKIKDSYNEESLHDFNESPNVDFTIRKILTDPKLEVAVVEYLFPLNTREKRNIFGHFDTGFNDLDDNDKFGWDKERKEVILKNYSFVEAQAKNAFKKVFGPEFSSIISKKLVDVYDRMILPKFLDGKDPNTNEVVNVVADIIVNDADLFSIVYKLKTQRKLFDFNFELLKSIRVWVNNMDKRAGRETVPLSHMDSIISDIDKDNPDTSKFTGVTEQARSFYAFLVWLKKYKTIRWEDVHEENVMIRPSTGDIVLSDPGLFFFL